jgi:hypothetical protein
MLLINAIKQATQNKYKPVSKAISNSVIVEGENLQLKNKVSILINIINNIDRDEPIDAVLNQLKRNKQKHNQS